MKSVSLENSRGYMNTTLKNGECPELLNNFKVNSFKERVAMFFLNKGLM